MSAKAGLFFLICLTSQRSGRLPDLWHPRPMAEHISVIRKEKPSTVGTHGTACHTATAGLRTSLSHTVAQSLLFRTTSPSILRALALIKACPWWERGYTRLTMWWQNPDYCRGSTAFNLYPKLLLNFFPSDYSTAVMQWEYTTIKTVKWPEPQVHPQVRKHKLITLNWLLFDLYLSNDFRIIKLTRLCSTGFNFNDLVFYTKLHYSKRPNINIHCHWKHLCEWVCGRQK